MQKKYQPGNTPMCYPIRGPIEQYPNYIQENGQQKTLPQITEILNQQETTLQTNNHYDTIYSGDLNFITKNNKKITNLDTILDTLNINHKKIKNKK